jgi:hypothetical protein
VTAPRPQVELIVDEVVLRGIPPERAPAVATALETGLGKAVESSGVAPRADRVETARRLPTVAAPSASPGALGDAVAAAVWTAIANGGTR